MEAHERSWDPDGQQEARRVKEGRWEGREAGGSLLREKGRWVAGRSSNYHTFRATGWNENMQKLRLSWYSTQVDLMTTRPGGARSV